MPGNSQIKALLNQELFQPITPEEKINLQLGFNYAWLNQFDQIYQKLQAYLNIAQGKRDRLRQKQRLFSDIYFICVLFLSIFQCLRWTLDFDEDLNYVLSTIYWVLWVNNNLSKLAICCWHWIESKAIQKKIQTIMFVNSQIRTKLPVIAEKLKAQGQAHRMLAQRRVQS